MKRVLREMSTEVLYKTFKVSKLDEIEYKLMQLFYIKSWKRDEICKYLNISISTFTRTKQKAETKIKITLLNLLDDKLHQMSQKMTF